MIEDLFSDMRAEAEAVVRLGVPLGVLSERRTAFMRYRGQGHEIAVPLDGAAWIPQPCARIRDDLCAIVRPDHSGLEIEAVTWTLALSEPYALPSVDPLVVAPSRRWRRERGKWWRR